MKKIVLIILLLVLSFGTIGCVQESTTPEPTKDSEQEQPEKKETEEENRLIGEALVEERCIGCHSLSRVESANYDRAGWESKVNEMIEKGTQLSEDEEEKVIDYLSGQ